MTIPDIMSVLWKESADAKRATKPTPSSFSGTSSTGGSSAMKATSTSGSSRSGSAFQGSPKPMGINPPKPATLNPGGGQPKMDRYDGVRGADSGRTYTQPKATAFSALNGASRTMAGFTPTDARGYSPQMSTAVRSAPDAPRVELGGRKGALRAVAKQLQGKPITAQPSSPSYSSMNPTGQAGSVSIRPDGSYYTNPGTPSSLGVTNQFTRRPSVPAKMRLPSLRKLSNAQAAASGDAISGLVNGLSGVGTGVNRAITAPARALWSTSPTLRMGTYGAVGLGALAAARSGWKATSTPARSMQAAGIASAPENQRYRDMRSNWAQGSNSIRPETYRQMEFS